MARLHPKVKIIFAHAFFTSFRDLFLLSQLYLLSPGTVKNVYVDISAIIPVFQNHPERDLLIWHLREFGVDRLFFASDYPVFTPQTTIEALQQFGFTREELNGIMGANFEREILGNYIPTLFPNTAPASRLGRKN